MTFKQLTELPSRNGCFACTAVTTAFNHGVPSPVTYVIKDETLPTHMYRYDHKLNQWTNIKLFEAGKTYQIKGSLSDRVWIIKDGNLHCWLDDKQCWQNRSYNLENNITNIALSEHASDDAFALDKNNKLYYLDQQNKVWVYTDVTLPYYVQDMSAKSRDIQSLIFLCTDGRILRISSGLAIEEIHLNLNSQGAIFIKYGSPNGQGIFLILTDSDQLAFHDPRDGEIKQLALKDTKGNLLKNTSFFYNTGFDIGGPNGEFIVMANNDHLYIKEFSDD